MADTLHPRASSVNVASPDMHHRPLPTVRSSSSFVGAQLARSAPLLPANGIGPTAFGVGGTGGAPLGSVSSVGGGTDTNATICGLPLKYVSLVTLAVQNAALSIVMHYSRVSTPPSQSYSPASAVLLNEILKGSISLVIALWRVYNATDASLTRKPLAPVRRLYREIFSPDCWKLSIPALLYVVQNSLQFVAISNLPVATFQVTYQMKILTTAAFSVALLGKKLGATKWVSLFFLALGVGIVQIQTTAANSPRPRNVPVGSAHESAPFHMHVMSPLKGFGAVTIACMTSGLAGVYFEMVLKGSKADLWVRNVQLSLFSLVPALLPILYSAPPAHDSRGFVLDLFRHFGGWAWGTVAIQVFGGLVTAVVIKYSDNILKGFATSLSIILSFLASVVLFDFRITPSFVLGSSTVLVATALYNQPAGKESIQIPAIMSPSRSKPPTPFPGTPIGPDEPILGHFPEKKSSSPFGSPRAIASSLGLASSEKQPSANEGYFGQTGMKDTSRYLNAPYGSPFPSRTPSPHPHPGPHSHPPSRAGSAQNVQRDLGTWKQ